MTQKVAEMGPPFAPPPERIEAMKETQMSQLKNPVERVQSVAKSAIGLFVLGCFTAALCLLGVLVFGGKINYWQALAAVFYSWLPVIAIQKILGPGYTLLESP
jgi:hypothetical protein